MSRKRKEPYTGPAFSPCGICVNGWVTLTIAGVEMVQRCACWDAYVRATAPDAGFDGPSRPGRQRMSDYVEVLWSGKGTIPGMSGEGWTQRQNNLLAAAPGPKDWITDEESNRMTKALRAMEQKPRQFNNQPTGKKVGRPVTSSNRTRVCTCGRKKNIHHTICNGCRLGRPVRNREAA